MAPVLQCPDCGSKHPLASVPDAGTFPCRGCGRLLKVPELVPRTARSSAPPTAPAVPPVTAPATAPTGAAAAAAAAATRVLPPVEPAPRPPVAVPPPVLDRAPRRPPPWWVRLALWIVAVPAAFLAVFVFARAIGVFTADQLTDVYLATGTSRFWPVARLLPFVALVAASLVHGGVHLLSRRRRPVPARPGAAATVPPASRRRGGA
jgi:hypothetical protein